MNRNPGASQLKNQTPPPKTGGGASKPTAARPSTRTTPDYSMNAQAGKTREQLYKGDGTGRDWTAESAATACEYLIQKCFIAEETDRALSYPAMALVLLRVAATTSSVVSADALRAVARILDTRRTAPILEEIAAGVRELLDQNGSRGVDAEGVEEVTAGLRDAAVMLTRTVEEQCGVIETQASRMTEEVNEVVEAAATAKTATTKVSDSAQVGERTYAAVATNPAPPPRHAAMIAVAAARTRQIRIERAPGTQEWLQGLSHKEVLLKARMASELMVKDGCGAPPDEGVFVGAEVRRDSVLLHLKTTQAADWLRANMPRFLDAMGGTTVYKQRLYNVVVQFVSVSFDPSLDGALHSVEGDNNMPSGSLAKVHWIKPPARRNVGQKVAHAVFGFNEPTPANSFIRSGLFVEGKLVNGHKLVTEPVRCMKCQEFGHIATVCRSIHEACARCGGMHQTKMCTATDDERACSNCRIAHRPHEGHGAADRSCPVFQDKLQFALERNPEAKYPYFPEPNDPSTWVTHDELAQSQIQSGGGRQPQWQAMANARRGRGPGPSAEVSASLRQMTTTNTGPMFGGAARARFPKGVKDIAHETGGRQTALTDGWLLERGALGERMDPGRVARLTGGRERAAAGGQEAVLFSDMAPDGAVAGAGMVIPEETEEQRKERWNEERKAKLKLRTELVKATRKDLVFHDDLDIPPGPAQLPELPELDSDAELPDTIALITRSNNTPGGPVNDSNV